MILKDLFTQMNKMKSTAQSNEVQLSGIFSNQYAKKHAKLTFMKTRNNLGS